MKNLILIVTNNSKDGEEHEHHHDHTKVTSLEFNVILTKGKKLYIFLKLNGDFVAANFTGM